LAGMSKVIKYPWISTPKQIPGIANGTVAINLNKGSLGDIYVGHYYQGNFRIYKCLDEGLLKVLEAQDHLREQLDIKVRIFLQNKSPKSSAHPQVLQYIVEKANISHAH